MALYTNNTNVQIAGLALQGAKTKTGDGANSVDTTLPAAKAGTLTTRTSDTAGTLTMGAAHGFTDGQVVDLYWTGGRRYNVVVGTVAGTSVPFTSGAGDNLPIATTAITLAAQTTRELSFNAANLLAIAALCKKRGIVLFYESSTLRLAVDLTADEIWNWDGVGANPLSTYAISSVRASTGTEVTAGLQIGALLSA